MKRIDWRRLIRNRILRSPDRTRRSTCLTPCVGDIERLQQRQMLSAGPIARMDEPPETVTSSGALGTEFIVRYEAAAGIDIVTIDELDLLIENSAGDGFDVELVGVSGADEQSPVDATFRITPPVDGWSRSDNGVYSIRIAEGEVLDSEGTEIAETNLGIFEVRVANQGPTLNEAVRLSLPTFERGVTFGILDLEVFVSDPDDDELQIVAIDAQPQNGSVRPGGFEGEFSYEPLPEFAGGEDSFVVRVSDGTNELAVPVTIDVEHGTEPPQIALLELNVARVTSSDQAIELTGVFYDDRNIVPASVHSGNFVAVGPWDANAQPIGNLIGMRLNLVEGPVVDEFGDVTARYTLDSHAWRTRDEGIWRVFAWQPLHDADGQTVSLTEETIPTFDVDLSATPEPQPQPDPQPQPEPTDTARFQMRATDRDGQPINSVRVGDEFTIEVVVNDERVGEEQLGLVSAYVDVLVDNNHLEVIELTNHAIGAASGNVQADGTIDEAGGFITTDRDSRITTATLISLRVRAIAEGTTTLKTDPADVAFHQTAFRGPGGQNFDARDQAKYGELTLRIRDALSLSASADTISENGGTATLTVQRDSDDFSGDLLIQLSASSENRVSIPQAVTIPDGARSASFPLTAVDNARLEGSVDVTIQATGPGYNAGSVTIAVTDHETLSLTGPAEISEADGTMTLTLRRSDEETLDEPLIVHITSSDESQLSLRDSTIDPLLPFASTSRVTIPAGEASVDVMFDVHDNDVLDGDRQATITAQADGYEAGRHDVTIQDAEHSDVVVTSFDVVSDRIDHGSAIIRLTLTNNGLGPAREFDVALVHSDDEKIDLAEDAIVGRVHLDELRQGESRTIEQRVDLDLEVLLQRALRDDPAVTGDVPAEGLVSSFVDWLAAAVDPDGVLDEKNDAGTALANNAGQGQFIDMDDVTALPFDLDGDGLVAPLDALFVIDRIGQDVDALSRLDFDGDGLIAPLDVLTVIDRIGRRLNESATTSATVDENPDTKPDNETSEPTPPGSEDPVESPETVDGTTDPRVLVADSREQGQMWQYTTAQPAETWIETDFDDSSWESGEAGFGRQGTPGSVVRTEWHGSDIWLRKSFNVTQVPEKLTLDLHYDEASEVYLNGTLVHSTQGYAVDYQEFPLDEMAAGALRVGRNVIAIHTHQTIGGQYVDAGLRATATPESNPAELPANGMEAPLVAVRQDLSEKTGVPIDDIRLVSVTARTWPNSSLGLPRPGEMYLQVITEGYAVVLEAAGREYLYHTAGDSFRYGGVAHPQPSPVASAEAGALSRIGQLAAAEAKASAVDEAFSDEGVTDRLLTG